MKTKLVCLVLILCSVIVVAYGCNTGFFCTYSYQTCSQYCSGSMQYYYYDCHYRYPGTDVCCKCVQTTTTTILNQESIEIELSEGWNLISIPFTE